MGIQAVFFNMEGTLERVWYTPGIRLQAIPGLKQCLLSGGFELDLSAEDLLKVVSAGYERYKKWSVETMSELPPQWIWNHFILAGYPVDIKKLAEAAEELMVYLESHFFQRELRQEVPDVLEGLRKMGLKIGLISNVCSKGLIPGNLNRYGISNYFDPVVLSSQFGHCVPDPAIFHYGAQLANLRTGRCAYVSGNIANAMVGAHRAGFGLTIQIISNFDQAKKNKLAKSDAIINNLMELLDILKEKLGMTTPVGQRRKQVRALLFYAGDIIYYRQNRAKNLRYFLQERRIAYKKIPRVTRSALKLQASKGLITRDQYREKILRLYGLTDPVQIEFGKYAMDEDDNNIKYSTGVLRTLKKLKNEGYRLGLITDASKPTHVQWNWLELGVSIDVWDTIISLRDLGIQKADSKTYQSALEQLELTVNQVIFVGNNPEALDVARAHGMKTIAFNNVDGTMADFQVDTFSDLLKVPLLCRPESVE